MSDVIYEYPLALVMINHIFCRPNFVHALLDADMAFCKNLRENGDFFFVSNRVPWGHLVATEDFSTAHVNNELWEMENNKYDWELRYLHPNYSKSLEEGADLKQPCPDVYWFPIVTERFADELVNLIYAIVP